MALKEINKEIEKLSTADQYRLKGFFTKSLAYSASEPVFKEVSEQKMGTLAFTAIRKVLFA
jgi:hypothetical protein